jgi:hypothetical protein
VATGSGRVTGAMEAGGVADAGGSGATGATGVVSGVSAAGVADSTDSSLGFFLKKLNICSLVNVA